MLRHFLFLVPVAVAALALWNPPLSWLRDGVIYVSPQGSDWYSGRSPGSAVATIQRAADMVAAGETILILPGVYREELRVRRGGAPDKPVVFRAVHPGTVTISGAAPDDVVERLFWRNEGGKIWSAATPWPIYHAVGDGENFFHVRWAAGAEGDKVYHWVGTEGRVARLRELISRPKAWGAFAWEQGRLYVAFADGRSPREHTLQINRAIPRPYASWSIRAANVWVEADHVRFEGLQFHLGVGAGLLLWNAQDVIVRDALFSGAMFGVSNFPRASLSRKLVVEHSHYHNYPQYFWFRDWLSWEEIFSHHSNSTLISATGDGVIVRYNLITHAGDGLQLYTPAANVNDGVEIYGNLAANGTDDGIEIDGHAIRVHLHHNVIYNFPTSLGMSPVLTGPVLVRDNLSLHPPRGEMGAHLKWLNPWQGRGGVLSGSSKNVVVRNNVFSGKWLAYSATPLERVRVESNVFADVVSDERFGMPAGVVDDGNIFLKSPQGSSSPDVACQLKLAARFARRIESSNPIFPNWEGTSGHARLFKVERPGPAWLDYDKYPASQDAGPLVEQWMKVANRCD